MDGQNQDYRPRTAGERRNASGPDGGVRDWQRNTWFGPAPLNVVKVNDRFRYRVNVTGKNSAAIRKALSAAVIECSGDKRFRGVSIYADHDPSD